MYNIFKKYFFIFYISILKSLKKYKKINLIFFLNKYNFKKY
jgi:hypothetical protein